MHVHSNQDPGHDVTSKVPRERHFEPRDVIVYLGSRTRLKARDRLFEVTSPVWCVRHIKRNLAGYLNSSSRRAYLPPKK